MYDINNAGGLASRREFKKDSGFKVSASLAVRKGYRAEAEKPLPAGVASKRQARRVPTLMQVLVNGEWRRVSGDISAGGALILADERIATPTVDVAVGAWNAKGTVIGVEVRGQRFAHHVRFEDASSLKGLDEAVQRALASGEHTLQPA